MITDKGTAMLASLDGERAMNPSSYTKDTLVQQTTAEYLQHQHGWKSVSAYTNKDFGPNSLMNREVTP